MKVHHALKHLFIPHEGNDYKPHFFRELSVSVMLFASIFLLGFSAGSSYFLHKTVLGAHVVASVLVDLTNESRLLYNQMPLTINPKLEQAARLKGEDMAKYQYFAHVSPEGVTPWHWFKEAGYVFVYAGENLAINFTESKDVEDAWLASPKHRENILNVKFTEIGIATVDGIYNDKPTTFVVQMFGTPAQALTKAAPSQDTLAYRPDQITSSSTGSVKGEATGTPIVKDGVTEIITTPTLAVVKNNEDVDTDVQHLIQNTPRYSMWYDRLLFGGSSYVDVVYKILIIVIALALVTMILIEVKKQHYKHIMYGVGLLLLLTIFVTINQTFIY